MGLSSGTDRSMMRRWVDSGEIEIERRDREGRWEKELAWVVVGGWRGGRVVEVVEENADLVNGANWLWAGKE